MDIATIVGILAGIGLILAAIMMGSGLGAFIDIPSVLVTVGGSVAAMFIAYPLDRVIGSIQIAMKAFFSPKQTPEETIERIVGLAVKARKESIIALEKEVIEEPFLAKGIQLVVDGTAPSLVRSILKTEIGFMKQRHTTGQKFYKTLGAMGPAFGMIGTLIGLVQMLQSLDDPSSIGPAMAVALLTTFYGALLANLIAIPIAEKLGGKSAEEVLMMEVIIEGVLSILEGDNPMIVRSKLEAFLSPKLRQKPDDKE
ncbi:MAG: MotA/TolQ/ExbB proton channel family protein [Deltaproteobacteria bacterium]|nr:MotA/TolQ/ExbB proton channel family protein [Candidatus Anaeroferrophillacea bacterium]